MRSTWKKIRRQLMYTNQWFKLYEDQVVKPNGQKGIYSFIKTSGPSVFIIALNENNHFPLVRLYRYPTKKWSWELPAGGSTHPETPLAAAKRELQEETGLSAKKWQKMSHFQVMNGVADEISWVYVAKNLSSHSPHNQEEGIIEVKTVSFEEAFGLIKVGEISDGQTIAALALTSLKLMIW